MSNQPKVYNYIPEEGIIIEKATIEKPSSNKVYDAENTEYRQHLFNLKTYPVSSSLREQWKADREVTEGKDFLFEDQFWEGTAWWPTKHLVKGKAKEGTKLRKIAVPTQGELPVDGLMKEQEAGEKKDKQLEKIREIVSDQELEEVWGNANFGPMSKRDIVRYSLLKCASGYYTGKTAKHILMELGLVSERWLMTRKGMRYLYEAFCQGNSI